MSEPTVALVFSPNSWVEELHRHLAHHGGARVRQIVVEPSVALDEEYDVLVVSDRWPSLTFGFVGAVHDRGRGVLGVFDPSEPAGKDHLVDLGVDATIASDAAVADFVAAVRELGSRPVMDARAPGCFPCQGDHDDAGAAVFAVSGTRGSGVTEVAIGLSVGLAERRRSVALLDAHETAPALAGRLGLALEPNLRTAVDACTHGLGTLDDCATPVLELGKGAVFALPGYPSAVAASQVTTYDLLDVIAEARRRFEFVIIDLEERSATSRAVLELATAVVGVVSATPVGVVRAIEWATNEVGRTRGVPLHLLVNRAPRSGFRRDEVRAEIERTLTLTSIAYSPNDQAVEVAAWDGDLVGRGRFRAACARLAGALDPVPSLRRGKRVR